MIGSQLQGMTDVESGAAHKDGTAIAFDNQQARAQRGTALRLQVDQRRLASGAEASLHIGDFAGAGQRLQQ